jgi:hypothetical protein
VTANAGFDIAKDFHWLAVTDEHGQLLFHHRVDNDPDSIDQAIAELLAVPLEHGQVTIGLDIMGGIASLLTAMLLAAGPRCVHIPGLAVNRARRGTRGGENKSDPRDSKVIAARVMLRNDLRAVTLSQDSSVELRLLVTHRAVLVKETTARTARLRDLLGSIHPGLERVVDPTTKTGLLLLAHYVTPAELRRAGINRVADYLRRRGAKRPTADALAQAAVTVAQAQRIALPGERRTAALVRELAEDLLAGHSRLKGEDDVGSHAGGARRNVRDNAGSTGVWGTVRSRSRPGLIRQRTRVGMRGGASRTTSPLHGIGRPGTRITWSDVLRPGAARTVATLHAVRLPAPSGSHPCRNRQHARPTLSFQLRMDTAIGTPSATRVLCQRGLLGQPLIARKQHRCWSPSPEGTSSGPCWHEVIMNGPDYRPNN